MLCLHFALHFCFGKALKRLAKNSSEFLLAMIGNFLLIMPLFISNDHQTPIYAAFILVAFLAHYILLRNARLETKNVFCKMSGIALAPAVWELKRIQRLHAAGIGCSRNWNYKVDIEILLWKSGGLFEGWKRD